MRYSRSNPAAAPALNLLFIVPTSVVRLSPLMVERLKPTRGITENVPGSVCAQLMEVMPSRARSTAMCFISVQCISFLLFMGDMPHLSKYISPIKQRICILHKISNIIVLSTRFKRKITAQPKLLPKNLVDSQSFRNFAHRNTEVRTEPFFISIGA